MNDGRPPGWMGDPQDGWKTPGMDDGTSLGWMGHPWADVLMLSVDVPPTPHADLIKFLINTTPLRSEVGPLVQTWDPSYGC